MKKVLLLSMPFGALERQALGLSLLKAQLTRCGIDCDLRYLTFTFADLIGADEYYWISTELPHTAFVGEWVFTRALYGEDIRAENTYIKEVLHDAWHLHDDAITRILHIRSMAPHFFDHCMGAVPWHRYALVGFTSTFEQNIASLALAKRIKDAYPGITTVFGGANWESEMGLELHRRFPFVDYACVGEADKSFPSMVERLFKGRSVGGSRGAIPGLIYRSNGRSIPTKPAELVCNMDQLPIPDYSDYFRDIEQSSAASVVVPTLLFESSRGCWWGAKSHCTFCGLNGRTMTFRSKSAPRAIRELEALVDAWQIDSIQAVDNVVDMKYFSDFLPEIGRAGRGLQFFYEVRANLTREHVRTLREAGVLQIQPGIESLGDRILRLMRKGTSALRNVQLLKWCKEYGVTADWNLLYGFPGETREDYVEMMKLLPLIRFLRPPTACGPIRLDRFSPYYASPEAFGLTNVRPMAPYKYLYPFDDASLMKIAYYFDYDYEPRRRPHSYAADVVSYVEDWQQHPETGTLRSTVRPDGALILVDTRSDAARRVVVLTGIDREVYEYCDSMRSWSAVAKRLRRAFPSAKLAADKVRTFLQCLVTKRLMVTDGTHYLSLAIRSHETGRAREQGARAREFALAE